MRFTVTWDPPALAELTNLWLNAPDQQAVADAADEIDRLLRLFPLTAGEAHGADRRLAVEPLQVLFTVSPDDCLVRVFHVSVFG
jgi:hypothetical protein